MERLDDSVADYVLLLLSKEPLFRNESFRNDFILFIKKKNCKISFDDRPTLFFSYSYPIDIGVESFIVIIIFTFR